MGKARIQVTDSRVQINGTDQGLIYNWAIYQIRDHIWNRIEAPIWRQVEIQVKHQIWRQIQEDGNA